MPHSSSLKVQADPPKRVQTPRRCDLPPADAVLISVAQLRSRWGGVSQMFIERKISGDPTFPRPIKLGGSMFRFFRLPEIEQYERAGVTK